MTSNQLGTKRRPSKLRTTVKRAAALGYRPRRYQSFLAILVPTLLFSLVQISRLSQEIPAADQEQSDFAHSIPLAVRSSSAGQKEDDQQGSSSLQQHQSSQPLQSQYVPGVQKDASVSLSSQTRKLAVVTFADSMDYYLWGVYSIHNQLKKVGMLNSNDSNNNIRHVALVAKDMKSKHKQLITEWLGSDNVIVVDKTRIRRKVPKGFKLWGAVFSKMEFFNLTQFDKLIALDNDVLIRKNIAHWFDYPAPAATQARGEIEWNSGAMVIEPNSELYETLLDYIAKTRLWKPSLDDGIDTWNSGDGHQGFLSAFFTSNVTEHSMFTMNYGCSVLSSDLEDRFENQYYWKYRNDAIETMHLTKHKPWKEKTETSKPATCAMLREWGESVKDAPMDKMPDLPDYLRKCSPPLGEDEPGGASGGVEMTSEANAEGR